MNKGIKEKRGRTKVLPRNPKRIKDIDKLRDPHHFEMVLKALGSLTRMKIMKFLSKKPKPIQEIANEMGMSQPACSAQIRILWTVGFLKRERKGNQTFYFLNKSFFLDFQKIVREFLEIEGTFNPKLSK